MATKPIENLTVLEQATFREEIGANNASNITSGTLALAYGGTGSGTAAGARTALGVDSAKQFRASNYGARADGVTLFDAVYTNGSTALTSASAAFTAADVGKSIVLQISQGVRQILTIASVTNGTTITLSANASGNSVNYAFQSVTYGTDNTAFIQAAINATAANNGGGGSVIFDGGTYLCTGSPSDTSNRNSIFAIPFAVDPRTQEPITIELIGPVPPGTFFADPDQLPHKAGTIIYCPNQTATGSNPSVFAVVKGNAAQEALISGTNTKTMTRSGNVFTSNGHGYSNTNAVRVFAVGGNLPSPLEPNVDYFVRDSNTNTFSLALTSGGAVIELSGGSGTFRVCLASIKTYWGAVTTTTSFKNITVRQVPNPKLHALQFRWGGRLLADDVCIDLDVPYSSEANLLIDPNSGAAIGIICPDKLSGYGSNIGRAYIYGYYAGIEIGDLTSVAHLTAEFCYICTTSRPTTNYMNALVLNSYRCTIPLVGPMAGGGGMVIHINLFNIETYRGGGITYAPAWTYSNNGNIEIDIPLGAISGHINVSTVLAGTGLIPTTVRTGTSEGPAALTVYDLVTRTFTGKNESSSITVKRPFTPAAPTLTVNGTGGSTNYSYRIGYKLLDGSIVLSSVVSANAAATLGGAESISVIIPPVNGCANYFLYRTASSGTPSTLGLITTGSAGTGGYIPRSGAAITDNGIAADTALQPIETVGTVTAERLELTGNARDSGFSVLDRDETDARYGQRIYHEVTSDVTNGTGSTTVSSSTVTVPVGKWLVRGSIFVTRNATTSNCRGELMWVSGGTTVSGRMSQTCNHNTTFNGDPFTFATGGSIMGGSNFSAGSAILGGTGMDTVASGSKVMIFQGNGFINVTGSPSVLRFQVTQTTADAVNPAILKAQETYVEFQKIN
jgi:hypothetical protein